jgi:hypothetical protein
MNFLNRASQIITESVTASPVTPFEFSGTISEAFSAATSMLRESVTSMEIDEVLAQEIIIEASMNPELADENIDAMNEGFIGGIIDGIKKFFTSIKTWIVGLYNKIKERMAMNTRNIEKFLKAVKGPLAQKTSKDVEKFEYTGYKWNSGFISSPVSISKHEALAETLSKDTFKGAVEALDAYNKAIKNIKDDLGSNNNNAVVKGLPTSIIPTTLKDGLSGQGGDKASGWSTEIKDHSEKFVEEKLGFAASDIKPKLTEAARDKEKVVITGFKSTPVDAMVKFLDDIVKGKSSESRAADALKKLQGDVDSVLNKLNSVGQLNYDKDTTASTEYKQKLSDRNSDLKVIMQAVRTAVTAQLSAYQTSIATVNTLRDDAATEFMGTLRRYAGKGAVKSKD